MAHTDLASRAADLAIRPEVLPSTASLADVRRTLASAHKHLALVVDTSGQLLTTLDSRDLDRLSSLPDATPAAGLGTLAGRTVPPHLTAAEVTAVLHRTGSRRLAVVDADGRLRGLLCHKRSGRGFCSEEDITGRRSDDRRTTAPP